LRPPMPDGAWFGRQWRRHPTETDAQQGGDQRTLAKVRNVLGILLKNSGSRRARKLPVKTLGALPPHDDLLDDTIQLVDPEQVRVSRRTLRERAPRASQPQRSPNNLPQTPPTRSPRRPRFQGIWGHLSPSGGPSAWMLPGALPNKKTADLRLFLMELAGLEPATSWVRSLRSRRPDSASLRAFRPRGTAPPTPSPTSRRPFSSRTTAITRRARFG
jgi:hypothetical protein